MPDPRVLRLARILCDYCLELKSGDRFAIRATALAEPLLLAVYEHALERGALPQILLRLPGADEGARRLGEFAIGTNRNIARFTRNILFDEKLGGTIHMAAGFGFPELGSQNRSAIHWDMLCDMHDGGTITVDGVKFYDGGEFSV